MPDLPPLEKKLLTPEEIKSRVDDFLFRLRNNEGEEYYAIFKELWVSPHEVSIWLDYGEDERRAIYERIVNSPPPNEDWQTTVIIQLVVFSLTDEELKRIRDEGLPQYKARAAGFEDFKTKEQRIEEVLTQYLELRKYYDSSLSYIISWKNLVADKFRHVILEKRAYVEPDGTFSDETIEYFRELLSDYELEEIERLKQILSEAEQRMVEHMYIPELDRENEVEG